MEAIIESVDEFYSENLAQEVRRGMREAASRGFWVSNNAPLGYKRVYVADGGKKRPRLELDPPADAVARRIFDMALKGLTVLDIAKKLNAEGIPTKTGKRWLKTTVHHVLTNEAYAGTLVWGKTAKDGAPPVRVDGAVPPIVTNSEFERVQQMLHARAPSHTHPRRAASPYLLSGLVTCALCGKTLIASEAKGGKYTYYVCHTLLKQGKGACETPRLNAGKFERLIIDQLRQHILTESNIRELVKMLDEEMDGLAREQRQKLETIEEELAEVRRRLDRIWHVIETSDLDLDDATPRIRAHRERQNLLEIAATEARSVLAERKQMLDKTEIIAAFAEEMSEFLATSELTEAKAFVRSFVKSIVVRPGRATIHYTIPMPEDSPIGAADRAEIDLRLGVRNTVRRGGPSGTRTQDLRIKSPLL